MKVNAHILITGQVQGVWFRANTKKKAEELELTGWVKNTSDGNVEAVFEGEEESVSKMIDWCHRGPPMAKVEEVEVEKKFSIVGFSDFSIKY